MPRWCIRERGEHRQVGTVSTSGAFSAQTKDGTLPLPLSTENPKPKEPPP